MPVNVHLPLKVRIPASLTAEDLARLEVAVGNAMRNALERTREHVLEPRGPNRSTRVNPPQISFLNPPADELLRTVIEEAITSGLQYAVDASGVRQAPPAATSRPASLTTSVQERVEEKRFDEAQETYEIPVYDDGETQRVPVREEAPEGEPPPQRQPEAIGDLPTFEEAVRIACKDYQERTNLGRLDPTVGYPGYCGTLRDGRTGLLCITSLDARGGYTYTWIGTWVRGRGPTRFRPLLFDLTVGNRYTLRRIRDLTPRQVEEMLAEQLLQSDLPRLLRAEHPEWPPEAIDEGIRDAAGLALRDFMARSPEGFAEWELEGHGRTLPGQRSVSPVLFVVGRIVLGEGEGPPGAAAPPAEAGREAPAGERAPAGPPGGPLGRRARVEGEGVIWPRRGADGERLVCQPFLGEPATSELKGGDELDDRIADLASKLGVPPCPYAGQFAINAARLIGGLARNVGIASTGDSAETTVRLTPEGGGNHGVVDIRPAQTPGLQYMHLLAETAPLIAELARSIMRIYNHERNREKVYLDAERQGQPDYGRWALWFGAEFNASLINSCMHLYAETCRVILLQQLRSSRRFIEARLPGGEGFERAKQSFDAALGIMGESIVRLMVLRQAIRQARRFRRGGSAREVLSRREPAYGYYGPGYYEAPVYVPPPSASIPEAIFKPLSAASIEQRGANWVAIWEGRHWTEQDLEQHIALRRGLLNRIDPLFLQVEDLEALYRRFSSDPDSTGDYLENLLKEMADANKEITNETSDEDDGAFFALETSQYIKARGGFTSRGLRFEMHGIHKLADDELYPRIRGLGHYREGVNRAIGRKAGLDELLAVGTMAGMILLGVICAPLGAVAAAGITGAAGLGLTALDYLRAAEREEIYRAFEDPEAILSYQEVELEYMMAHLGAVFSVFDVVGVGRAVRGARSALSQAVRGQARQAVRAAYRGILNNLSGEILERAIRQAVSEAAIQAAMTQVLPHVIEPVLTPYLREAGIERGAGVDVSAWLESRPKREVDVRAWLESLAEAEVTESEPEHPGLGAGE